MTGLNLIEIKNKDDSRISVFHSLKLNLDRFNRNGFCLIEGEVSLGLLLESALKIDTLFLEKKYYDKYESIILSRPEFSEIKCFVANRSIMNTIVGFRLHHGVMALANRPEPLSINELRTPAICLNAIEKAENVGTITRTAVSFGISSFVVDKFSCDPLSRRSIRVSMGSVLFSNIVYVDTLFDSLREFRSREKIKILSLEQDDRSEFLNTKLENFDFLVIGNEGRGVDERILELSDSIIEIPLKNDKISSLNVGVSLGVALSRIG